MQVKLERNLFGSFPTTTQPNWRVLFSAKIYCCVGAAVRPAGAVVAVFFLSRSLSILSVDFIKLRFQFYAFWTKGKEDLPASCRSCSAMRYCKAGLRCSTNNGFFTKIQMIFSCCFQLNLCCYPAERLNKINECLIREFFSRPYGGVSGAPSEEIPTRRVEAEFANGNYARSPWGRLGLVGVWASWLAATVQKLDLFEHHELPS